MSYPGPHFDSTPPRRRPRARTVALAALVPGALLGWLVYEAVGAPGSGADGTAARPSSTAAASPTGSTGSTDPASPSATAGDDAKKPGAPSPASGSGPLKGKTVVVDPGHNPENVRHTAEINSKVDIGTNWKECDTTGTSTDAGYAEARFTLDVARRLRTLLEEQGATVRFTQDGDRPWGPCVDERARIGNEAHADAAISIHADGAPAGDRGFHVILPASVHSGSADTRPIVAASADLGERIAGTFVRVTGSAPANYVGDGTGLDTRKDLGGLNLSTVPKVFIECGNMRDSKDAALLTSSGWRQKAAQGISEGIVSFLHGS
ncbi:N-acetylmuramoyl-L-alanine amidase [Streptomyces griseoviridis]|uniref:N-acetylmuramoyl-L-alanine amidase n=1 Tax=Streptomyces griseoviridis TaxID=45398 RepID=A0A3Q9KYU1_STRGD|nr:N-acetylmuramoyl-L-alanine amidase [Streptomyces griseoviridis]AZS87602.1 N-acetylmuramoyl-L-alanine amidase [Streptomyces griseoviridis]QCN85551.1 N-acetylmuramoyl-L-alanine amidase [Streptomyces griseoviridis]